MTGPCQATTSYRLDPDAALPLTTLLLESHTRLAELARRCGYTNVAKGIRRLEELAAGELQHYPALRTGLAAALEIEPVRLDAAVADTSYLLWARDDRSYRDNFRPHVIWATTNSIPSPITIAGLINASGRLFWYPQTASPSCISDEAALTLPEGVACYGRVIGFHVNYTPDNAVSFDCAGNPLAVLDAVVRPGRARATVGGRGLEFPTTSIHGSPAPS